MNHIIRSVAIGLLCAVPLRMQADVIDQYKPVDAYATGTIDDYFGQLVHNDSSFAYDAVTFNFYADMYATTPAVAGTAYILDRPYTGTPTDLSASTPGVLASSIDTSGGLYHFPTDFVLQPASNYYVYTDTDQNLGFGTQQGDMDYPSQVSVGANADFMQITSNGMLFQLNGTAVPEPSACLLAALGGLSFFGVRRVRSKR